MSEIPTCPRHPDVETRLSCSACGEPICPSCGREASVGYKCPDCARQNAATTPRAGTSTTLLQRLLGSSGSDRSGSHRSGSDRWGSDPSRSDSSSEAPPTGSTDPDDQLPVATGARATGVATTAAIAAGLLIGPVLAHGTFFLLSAGVLGWVVARSVYWATEEHDSPYVRALAMTAAGVMVLVGQISASSGPDTVRELALLAYPAALYGGWIVVRQR